MSKRSLARSVCVWMDWPSAGSRLKEAACRMALTVLSQEGTIDLPQSDVKRPRQSVLQARPSNLVQVNNVAWDLGGVGSIEIELVGGRSSKSFKVWKELMDKYHYFGIGPLCGAQLRYLIQSSVYGCLGGLSFSSAAWTLKERDKFIGWSQAARTRIAARAGEMTEKGRERVPNQGANALKNINIKGTHFFRCSPLNLLVRPARFERATYGFVVRHSIQLSYGRIALTRVM